MPSANLGVFNIRKSCEVNMGIAQEDRVNVEKSMFKAHTFHFLLSAAKASLFPFLTIYFRLLGLTATQVGLVFAAQAIIRMWCAPVWTAYAKACRKKKFVLMFSTFILLASSLCLSLAPPSDPENSPLYCKGPLQLSKPGQSGSHPQTQLAGNATSNVIGSVGNDTSQPQPGLAENKNNKSAGMQMASKEDEVNKVHTGREHENATPTVATTTTVKAGTTSTTTASTTTTTTTPSSTTTSTTPTTTTRSSHRHGHNKHKDQENDATVELADKLFKKGVKVDELQNLSDDDLNKLLSSILNTDDQSADDTGSVNDRSNNYNYNYNYDTDKRWSSRQKRHGKEEDEVSGKKDKEDEVSGEKDEEDEVSGEKGKVSEEGKSGQKSTWDGFSERLEKEVKDHKAFAFVFTLMIVGELFAAPVDKLADDCWFEYLDVLDVVERYGGHRVWQLVGYVLLPTFAGTLVEKTRCILMHNVPHFMIHFFLFAAFAALSFMAAFGYPVSQNKRTPKQSRFGKGVRILCCDIHSMTLTITVLLLGMMYACVQNFLIWKVQDVGGNEIVIGTSITVSAVSAMFMYIMSNGIIKRITHVGAIVLALITIAGRLVFYSFLWTPWIVLAGEALHGFSYTLLWRAVEMFPDFRINPFIMDRSAFTLMKAIYYGLGIGIGSALSGFLYDEFGFDLLFQGASVVVAAWCAIFLHLQKCVKRKMKVRYAKLLQDDRGMDDSSDEDDWLEVAMKSGSR